MNATLEAALAPEVVFARPESAGDAESAREREINRVDVMAANWEAATAAPENLLSFLELLRGADAEYLGEETRRQAPVPPANHPFLDWELVSQSLSESQDILNGVQKLLSEIISGLGVADSQFIRVYADAEGRFRLTSGHPLREKIEAALNGPENRQFRELHAAALAGLSLAGGLVGGASVPPAVLERSRSQTVNAA
ncbi:MAG: hypothetical protein LBU64_03685 [Planctomycetota bacterium]|jgi:hypothetical protein|nr:hypothetical protein [Planctomycetota bacterium]